jgi:hypothetical protein
MIPSFDTDLTHATPSADYARLSAQIDALLRLSNPPSVP